MSTPNTIPTHKIAFLILAHNEAQVIGSTITSVLEDQDPGGPLFVVADNCTDDTASCARAAGAQVFTRTTGTPDGKGKALAWFMREHGRLLEAIDMLVILDADSKIKPGFNAGVKASRSPAQPVYQCFLFPVSNDQSPIGKLAALSELLDQRLTDRLRSRLKWPVRLRGTGMIIQPALLASLSQDLDTEVEDIALTLLLVAQKIPIARMEEVVVFDQKPGTAGAAAEQRARWFRGQWVACWHYRRQVIQTILRGPAGWSLLGSLFLRPKWLMVSLTFLLALVLLPWPWFSLAFWVLGSLSLVYYAIGLAFIPERGTYLRSLRYTPAFIWMWVRSLLLALRSSSWRRTRN